MPPPADTAPSRPGFFGRYQVLHVLGEGGMGAVYLGKLTGSAGFEKLCVLKTILPGLSTDPGFVERFLHEAKILVQLSHANIAQVYDMGEVDKTFYMALEYVPGVDLARVLERQRELGLKTPIPLALYIGQRVADALGYAHRKAGAEGRSLGIVHRDVSPHNVLVSYEGDVKVIDFGLAKSAVRRKQTLPATVMGKMGYMSPEQARGEELDRRSDIYSCGVVLYELMAGRPLLGGNTFGEMMAAMAYPREVRLSEAQPEAGAELDAILRLALASDPAKRYPRAEDLSRDLGDVLRTLPPIGAEEVGAFVRELCPQEFDKQRRLISGLSTVEAPPATRAASASGETGPTAIRASNPALPAAPAGGQAAETDAHGAADARPPFLAPTHISAGHPVLERRSRVPALVGAAGVLAAGAVVAVVLARGRGPGVSTPAPPSSEATAPAAVGATSAPALGVASRGAPASAPVVSVPAPAPTAAAPAMETSGAASADAVTTAAGARAKPITPARALPAKSRASAPEMRRSLELRFAALRKTYEDLVAQHGTNRIEALERLSYQTVVDDFERDIARADRHRDLEAALRDAEQRLARARRRLMH